jgi:hypothetical protein
MRRILRGVRKPPLERGRSSVSFGWKGGDVLRGSVLGRGLGRLIVHALLDVVHGLSGN